MGSSPVTATNSPALARLLNEVAAALSRLATEGSPGSYLVAFSGGADSSALLVALSHLREKLGFEVLAAHLDHGMDPGSAGRAAAAAELAARLRVPCHSGHREVLAERESGESLEEAARRVRYGFLEAVRKQTRADWILTAHHRDDQAETVLLRLLYGSGLAGLAGILPVSGRVARPLLALGRGDLQAALTEVGVLWLTDPTNASLKPVRNRLRARLLPALEREDPSALELLARVAALTAGLRTRLDTRLARWLDYREAATEPSLGLPHFAKLAPELQPFALSLLQRSAGAAYPPSRQAAEELGRQLARSSRIRSDCGSSWYWESSQRRLYLRRKEPVCAPFSYTFRVPGGVIVREVGLHVSLELAGPAVGSPEAGEVVAEIGLQLAEGDAVEIRNRRPGDRLQPVGRSSVKRLKEVLIDLGIPRQQRDRLPLLAVAGNLVWADRVGLDRRYCPQPGKRSWVLKMTRLQPTWPGADSASCPQVNEPAPAEPAGQVNT
ncbi:MAG: tRNA lysidine(34) synthetase TilS [Thermoanaerobaculia bacterium]